METWAAPDSLQGLLQRGRGRGYSLALNAPDAREHVLACIAHDPRWWPQIEQRGEYLARLVVELEIPVAELPIDPHDADLLSGIGFPVLVEMSRLGDTSAAAILHQHLSSTTGDDWTWAVDQVWAHAGAAARDGLRELILSRLHDDELAAAVTHAPDGPWQAWSDEPLVAYALSRAPVPQLPHRPDFTDVTRSELLSAADTARGQRGRGAALRELAARGDLALLDLAELEAQLGRGDSALTTALLRLGPVTLPRARSWVTDADPWLQAVGRDVVAAHGDQSDAPAILEWFDAAVDTGEWCDTEDLAAGLARLEHQPALPSLHRAWALTPHSTARLDYLRALIDLDSPELTEHLTDATDDCEDDVRDLAHDTCHTLRRT
ncbi:hypothetical protein [Cellulomonas sp. NS3]|uniref:hypothetical protein n=1 Tax=Cellulomonas sp. NS3 TaxID=2973977 RepID=UPI0021636866|nr:hypothetical protein [Cellulomonas sp. NS3]